MSEFNPVPTNYPNYTFHIQNSALFSNLGLTLQNFPKSGHLQLADTLLLHRRCPLIGENTVLLLCGDIESQPGLNNNSEFKTLISKKGLIFVIKILEVCVEKLTKFEKFYYHTTSTYLVYQKPLSAKTFTTLFSISEGTFLSDVIKKVVKVEVQDYTLDMESSLHEEPILKMTKLNSFGWKYG